MNNIEMLDKRVKYQWNLTKLDCGFINIIEDGGSIPTRLTREVFIREEKILRVYATKGVEQEGGTRIIFWDYLLSNPTDDSGISLDFSVGEDFIGMYAKLIFTFPRELNFILCVRCKPRRLYKYRMGFDISM